MAEFVQEREDKAWTEKTGRMIKKELSNFLEFVGDKPAGEMTREAVEIGPLISRIFTPDIELALA